MTGREINYSSWPRWAAAMAATALTATVVSACGGSSPAVSAAGGSTREQAALAYARCMRSHGVPGFPDPDSSGDFNLGGNQQRGGSGGGESAGGSKGSGPGGSGSSPVSSEETAANQVCNHLLNVGTQLTAAQTQHALAQLVKYAQCMRAHGVPNFPDPHLTSGGIGEPSGIGFDVSGLNLKSPRTQAASRSCQPLAAHAKG